MKRAKGKPEPHYTQKDRTVSNEEFEKYNQLLNKKTARKKKEKKDDGRDRKKLRKKGGSKANKIQQQRNKKKKTIQILILMLIKESSSNDVGLVTKESKGSTSSDKVKKVNKLGKKKDLGIIKTNSVNEIATKNKLIKDNKENENINCNEDSEEDSGDSFGLDENNSD